MNKLLLMTLRDIKDNKGQYIAVVIVIILGIAVYNSISMSFQNLDSAIENYYEEYRLPHLFMRFNSAPESVVNIAKKTDGVSLAQGRLVLDVPMEIDGYGNRIRARVVSVPSYNDDVLNKLHLEEGRYVSGNYQDRALLEKLFMEFHGLRIGDSVYPIIDGRKTELKISGKAISPEYIYAVPSAQEMMPDNERFTILYVKHDFLQRISGNDGMVNEVVVQLQDESQIEEVKKELERRLKNYGLLSINEREDEVSYAMMETELNALQSIGFAYPAIFLLIASIVIYMLLIRLVDNQRRQIGVLMALGFTKRVLLFHYIGYALFIGFAGSILGSLIGVPAAKGLARFYLRFFNVPMYRVNIYPKVVIIGLLMSVMFCATAGYNAAKRVLSIAPAEAMRPVAPMKGSKWWGERVLPFLGELKISWRLAFRNIWRNKKRTVFTLSAIAMVVGLMISILMMLDSMDHIFNKAFGEALSYDYKINFTDYVHRNVLRELREFEDIMYAEPIIEHPLRLSKGWREEDAMITGLSQNSRVHKLFDVKGKRVDVPGEGLLLTEGLAKSLGVKAGDDITMEDLRGWGAKKQIRVKGIVEQFLGGGGFMELGALNAALGEGSTINGALVKLKYNGEGLIGDIEDMPKVQSVRGPDDMVRQYNEYIELIHTYIGVIVVLSAIMGFAIIYNTTTISIMERKRELASLRTMGFTGSQVAELIFNENTAISAAGLVVGFPLGMFMGMQILKLVPEDLMALPLVIFPKTYILAAATVALFVALAQLANRRRISRMDLVEVMKSRE